MSAEQSEFNKRCNEIADHLTATRERRNADRIRRFEQDTRQMFGENLTNSAFGGSQAGLRYAATFFEGIDNICLGIFILGAKLSGGRKTNQE